MGTGWDTLGHSELYEEPTLLAFCDGLFYYADRAPLGHPGTSKFDDAKYSPHDRGLPGGAGGFWAPETARIGAFLRQTDGGVPQGFERLQECLRRGNAGFGAPSPHRGTKEASGR